jgi:hypothetical protein
MPATPPLIGARTGVLRTGESPEPAYLRRAARTSMDSQNPDGGLVESTSAYLDNGLRGRDSGTLTTQTVRVLVFDRST